MKSLIEQLTDSLRATLPVIDDAEHSARFLMGVGASPGIKEKWIRVADSFSNQADDIRELLVVAKNHGWLPISSAPKEGQIIDLFDEARYPNCYWDTHRGIWAYGIGTRCPTPTHWMPQPPNP